MSNTIPNMVTFFTVLAGRMSYDLIKHCTKDLSQEISEIASLKAKISCPAKT